MRKYIYSILVVLLVCVFSMNVYANEIVDGSVLTNKQSAEIIYNNPSKGNILNSVTGKITNNGDGSVNVYGSVYGSTTCDKIILEMTLQRLVNGSWKNIKTFSDTASNRTYLVKSYNVSVTKGYYYRIKVAGVATKNGTSESQVPVTDGIMIN